MSTEIEIKRDQAEAIGMIGAVVTYGNQQYWVHSVEGYDWYVFGETGRIILDYFDSTVSYLADSPEVTIVPCGYKMGMGRSHTLPMRSPFIRRGVCLTKSYR